MFAMSRAVADVCAGVSGRAFRRQVDDCMANETGAVPVEYALMAVTLTVALVAILIGIKDEENETYETLTSSFETILAE
jgi:Flp pilus assembly pilin Flp